MEINYFKPNSPANLLKEYKGLREPDNERDLKYSQLHDSVMNAIESNLGKYAPDAFDDVWMDSIFPERLTLEIMRLCEEQIKSITSETLIKQATEL